MSQNDFYIINWGEDFFDCSSDFEDLLGYSKEELNKFRFKHHSLIGDDTAEEIHNSIKNHFNNSDQKYINDIELISKRGKNNHLREFITFNNGKGYKSIFFNISEFKDKEIELNEIIEDKIRLNASKDKLISIISHDLRAPFTSLLGFSEILMNETTLPESERSEYLKYIYDASQMQLQMVNHLLDWTRLQAGTIKFNPQRLDIKDLIDSCVSVLTGSFIRKEIDVSVRAEEGFFVNVDERLISQAITNLLSNAVKFTPSGKKITVTSSLFKDNMIEIIISDEGVGIDEKHHDKLFRIDSKYSKTGTNGEKGSGFGLTLVKEIIEKHDGKIWFYSELGKGSEFHFTLPRTEDKILIVEEHKDLQEQYLNLINKKYSNLSISFSNNGFEAVNSILKQTPAFLITYHNMPLMSGLQIVSSLRKKDIHQKTTVVILSDDLRENEKNEYSKYGVNYILPVNSSLDEIDAILAGQYI